MTMTMFYCSTFRSFTGTGVSTITIRLLLFFAATNVVVDVSALSFHGFDETFETSLSSSSSSSSTRLGSSASAKPYHTTMIADESNLKNGKRYLADETLQLPTSVLLIPTIPPSTQPSFMNQTQIPTVPPTTSTQPSLMNQTIELDRSNDKKLSSPPRQQICPQRSYSQSSSSSFEKYLVDEYTDLNPTDGIDDDLAEISSLVFTNKGSTSHGGRYRYAYAVSDKEQFSLKVVQFDQITKEARTVATYVLNVPSTTNDDWEDISLGPCNSFNSSSPSTSSTTDTVIIDQTCIYIGNFGNNPRDGYQVRTDLQIFKFPEPYFVNGTMPIDRTVDVSTIEYRYEDGEEYDAEAMFVDWTGSDNDGAGKADIYIITKGKCGTGMVARIRSVNHQTIRPNEIAQIGEIDTVLSDPPKQGAVSCSDGDYKAIQGADMSRDGKLIAVIARQQPATVYFYERRENETITESLGRDSCDYSLDSPFGSEHEWKYEAVAFIDDLASSVATTSECRFGRPCLVPVYVHNLDYV